LILAAGLFPAAKTVLGQLPPPLVPKTELPPDEDQTNAVEKFSFNPVQSKREMTAGDFYFKKGNYTAAAARYERATKWNDGNAEAWLRLGESQEKKSNGKAAAVAYKKYLDLSPDAKNADDVKKKLAKLKG
jgi:tetratricopeptide (TPR) repeat protein